MSRIGKKPTPLPAAVNVSIHGRDITVESGGKRLSLTHRPEIKVSLSDDPKQIVVEREDDSRTSRAMHGLTRALINNMVVGVTKGFTKELQISGVGWNAKVQGTKIALNVGYADTRELDIAAGLTVQVQGNRIKISGADKQQVGQMAAQIRAQRPPEPYNGKGIMYVGEHIIRKQGKAFAAGAA